MKKLPENEMKDLLYAWFNGHTDSSENEIIGDWLKQDPEHEKIYDDLFKQHLFTLWATEEQDIDTETEQRRLMQSLRKKRRLYFPVRIAAAIVLFLVAGTIYLLTREEQIRYRPGTVEPVSSQAVLILSDGQSLNLNNKEISLQENNGVRIDVSPENGMTYSTESLSDTTLLFNRIIVPRGGEFFITLSDGTKVWLNADTELTFPVHFSDKNREVTLNGEAYFKVAHDENRQFSIRKGEYLLTVHGTEFNINTYNQYSVEVALISGKVGIKANTKQEEFLLSPGHLAVSDLKKGQTTAEEINLKPYTAWINKDMIFDGARLEEIMEDIARWYDADVFFRSKAAKSILFDINIPRYAEIEDVFYLLEKTSEVKFTLKGKTVIVDMNKK